MAAALFAGTMVNPEYHQDWDDSEGQFEESS
jgi:hypothetical protein